MIVTVAVDKDDDNDERLLVEIEDATDGVVNCSGVAWGQRVADGVVDASLSPVDGPGAWLVGYWFGWGESCPTT